MSFKIEKISFQEFESEKGFNAFVREHGRVFQYPEFLKSFGSQFNIQCVYSENELVAIIPLVIITKWKLKGYHIPPYGHIYGPVFHSTIKIDKNEVVKTYQERGGKLPFLEWKMPSANEDILPYLAQGGKIIGTQTHIVSSKNTYSEKSIHSSKRRYLKKLSKLVDSGELKVISGKSSLEHVLQLQKMTGESRGFNTSDEVLLRITQNLREEDYFSMVVSTSEGKTLAGAFCPRDKYSSYHIVNASVKHEEPLLNKSNLLSTFLAVKDASDRGLDFDFEGSNIYGIAQFYRMMGGEPKIAQRIQFNNGQVDKLLNIMKFLK